MLLSRLLPAAATLGALTLLSCSDPVPPPSEGGVFLHIFPGPSSSRPEGTACNVTTGHEARVPSENFPTANSTGSPVVDGENGASVRCTVAGSGTFSVSGELRFQGVSFTVRGGRVPAGSNGTATISSFDSVRALTMISDAPCTVTPLRVQEGAIWAEFDCPRYSDPQTPTTSSCASDGVFLLQNCDQ